jgi:hypothetical protein
VSPQEFAEASRGLDRFLREPRPFADYTCPMIFIPYEFEAFPTREPDWNFFTECQQRRAI